MKGPTRPDATATWSLPALLDRAGVRPKGGVAPGNVRITSLTDDSRQVERGGCFVAIRGSESDGHRFAQAAADAGAAVIVGDRDVSLLGDVVYVRVHDSREAIAKLAAAYYSLPGEDAHALKLIGVTGTNGKTTVVWLLRSILRAAGHATASIGTVEYDLIGERCSAPLTTPGAVDLCRHLARARDCGAEYAVLETSSHALDQRRTDGLEFAAGVFTNLSGDHLDYHKTMDAYWKAKRRLFDALDDNAVAVVNYDDPVGELMASDVRSTIVSFGIDTLQADVTAQIHHMDLVGSRFVLRGSTFELPVRCALVGRHSVMNVLAAAATAQALGIVPEVIVQSLEAFDGVPGRLQRVEPEGCPFTVLVDYAHTDDALSNVLQAVKPLTSGRLICVFGCGGDRDRDKRPRMAAVVGRQADIVYVTSDNPRTEDPQAIIEDILPGFDRDSCSHVMVQADRKLAIESAIAGARGGDVVLIAGKGHETYQLVGDKVLDFDDVKIARARVEAVAMKGSVA